MPESLLELYGVCCRVNSEFSLRDISLSAAPGEVLAIVGRNASGKSTLFSVITGMLPAESGELRMEGRPLRLGDAPAAFRAGIRLVGQNQQLFEALPLWQNVFFGQELKDGLGLLNNRAMRQRTAELFGRMGIEASPDAPLGSQSVGMRQLVGVARALASNAKLLLLDEPSTHLGEEEKERLYHAVNALKARGCAFLLISHDLDEVARVADRVAVMEQGILGPETPVAGLGRGGLIRAIYGIEPDALYRRGRCPAQRELLRCEGISGEGFSGIGFSLYAGQAAALVGGAQSGALPLARALAGLDRFEGKAFLDGAPYAPGSPIAAIQSGLLLAATEREEDALRQSERIVAGGGSDSPLARGLVSARLAAESLQKGLAGLFVPRRQTEYKTGGNRQRELMERAIRRPGKVYILLNPTSGMDIPARLRLYERLGGLLEGGAALLLLTCDCEEAAGFCDRALVMERGRLSAVLEGGELSAGALREIFGRGEQEGAN